VKYTCILLVIVFAKKDFKNLSDSNARKQKKLEKLMDENNKS